MNNFEKIIELKKLYDTSGSAVSIADGVMSFEDLASACEDYYQFPNDSNRERVENAYTEWMKAPIDDVLGLLGHPADRLGIIGDAAQTGAAPIEDIVDAIRERQTSLEDGIRGLLGDGDHDYTRDRCDDYFDDAEKNDDSSSLENNESIKDSFDNARNWTPPPRRSDPLVLDLDGDGVEMQSTEVPVMFDHNGDGVKVGSSWISSDDGFLVIDRNNNGVIDDGLEMFGDSTLLSTGEPASNGFEALKELDTNGDGLISEEDQQFSDLKVWKDLNYDGVSEESELFSLSEVGVTSISVEYQNESTSLEDGSEIIASSDFNTEGGRLEKSMI